MRCDVCDTAIKPRTGERITPDVFSYLLDNGFGLDETNIMMLTDAGMPRSEAEAALKNQYLQSKSDWLLCPHCVAEAVAVMARRKEFWVAPDYLAVTRSAEEVGLGFAILGAPVALSRAVWYENVEWSNEDTDRQIYQEQDARLWDVMFAAGETLQLKINQFMRNQIHSYSILCIPRDGASTDAIQVKLEIRPVEIRGQKWLLIDKSKLEKSEKSATSDHEKSNKKELKSIHEKTMLDLRRAIHKSNKAQGLKPRD